MSDIEYLDYDFKRLSSSQGAAFKRETLDCWITITSLGHDITDQEFRIASTGATATVSDGRDFDGFCDACGKLRVHARCCPKRAKS